MPEFVELVNSVWNVANIPVSIITMLAAILVPYNVKKTYIKQRFYEKRDEHYKAIQDFITRLNQAPDPQKDYPAFELCMKTLRLEIRPVIHALCQYKVWKRKTKKELSAFDALLLNDDGCCRSKSELLFKLQDISEMITMVPPIMT